MANNHYCKTCQQMMDESNFYSSFNLKLYPTGKLDECKKCATMMVDNFNPDTFIPLLEKIDIPYVPKQWMELVRKYCKDPTKVSGTTVLGRYISKMRLNQWREFHYADSEYLQNVARKEEELALKQAGYSAAEIEQYLDGGMEVSSDQRPTLPKPDSLASLAEEYAATAPGYSQPVATSSVLSGIEIPELEEIILTPEEKRELYLKWGAYRPDQWLKLEQMYAEFLDSYDIQSAGHIDTLKLICKTSLKANELIDLNDVEGYQKMSKVYDSLMRSGKFTANQNKNESNNFVDSISEIVAMCEKEGYIERFYTDEPKDMVDKVLWDTKNYLHTLVTEEMNLGDLIANAVRQIQDEQGKEQEMTDEEIFDNNEDIDASEIMTVEDFEDFNEFLESQQKYADDEEED